MKCYDYFLWGVKDGMVGTYDIFAKKGSSFRGVALNEEKVGK
jgi:hypothetical protein